MDTLRACLIGVLAAFSVTFADATAATAETNPVRTHPTAAAQPGTVPGLARAPRRSDRPTCPVAVGVAARWTYSPCLSELLRSRVLIVDAGRRTACDWPARAAEELAVSSEAQPEAHR
jgi:hypothetical protein